MIGWQLSPIDWNTEEKPYANPPWPLLSIVLEKVAHDKVKILMVVPDWPEASASPVKSDVYVSAVYSIQERAKTSSPETWRFI